MDGAATVIWLADRGALVAEAAPSEDAKKTLDSWASLHGVKLQPPIDPPRQALDWDAVTNVEQELLRVRDALDGLDFDAAERALARAGAILREHPELPNAAWLRAEVERAWSARWLRERDEDRARSAWQRAAGLDGGRAAGLGERAFDATPSVRVVIHLEDDEGTELRLDGSHVSPGELARSAGEHALALVEPEGRVAWAAWVAFAQGAIVRIAVPPATACSTRDMKQARLVGDAVRGDVRCASWVAAIAGETGVVRVATCEGQRCSSLVEWRSGAGAPLASLLAHAAQESRENRGRRWPAWASWTLAAVGVAGTAIAIAAGAGAFRSSAGAETQFVNAGLQIH